MAMLDSGSGHVTLSRLLILRFVRGGWGLLFGQWDIKRGVHWISTYFTIASSSWTSPMAPLILLCSLFPNPHSWNLPTFPLHQEFCYVDWGSPGSQPVSSSLLSYLLTLAWKHDVAYEDGMQSEGMRWGITQWSAMENGASRITMLSTKDLLTMMRVPLHLSANEESRGNIPRLTFCPLQQFQTVPFSWINFVSIPLHPMQQTSVPTNSIRDGDTRMGAIMKAMERRDLKYPHWERERNVQ
jgi:hypothetical protein